MEEGRKEENEERGLGELGKEEGRKEGEKEEKNEERLESEREEGRKERRKERRAGREKVKREWGKTKEGKANLFKVVDNIYFSRGDFKNQIL